MPPGAVSRKTPVKPHFSLISDDKFRQLYQTMVRLRASRGASARPRNIEAALAGFAVDLIAGDLVLAEVGLFPPDALPLERSGGAVPVFSYTKQDEALPATAAGAALGLRSAGDHGVVVMFCHAGKHHRHLWRASLTSAAQQRLPILFVLMPERNDDERTQASIAAEAVDAGVIAIPVDAADAVAMYRVAFESLARARRRTGPTLILATHYEVEGQKRKTVNEDPVSRMKDYLRSKGIALSTRRS